MVLYINTKRPGIVASAAASKAEDRIRLGGAATIGCIAA